ncbi:hypothetical protein PPYR_03920 [Photinus pyralis]|uniref:H15 domain-containing protein n=1 Tax=Photinus pyralis TaxID=7054 RepID=A0A5N4AWM3_PHOPY|nr:hypothetical protein PPYR_03920 [Photinus pyralis]
MLDYVQRLIGRKICRLDVERKPPLRTNSSSLVMKVLLALVSFQTDPCFSNGATVGDITTYLRKTYVVDGDLHSQVHTAIRTAVTMGYISEEQNCKYVAIPFTAAVQQTLPNSRKRKRAVRKTRRIFSRQICDEDTSNSGGNSDCSSVASVCKGKRRRRKSQCKKRKLPGKPGNPCDRDGGNSSDSSACDPYELQGRSRMRTRNYKA